MASVFWGTVDQTRPNAANHKTSPGGSQTSAMGRALSLIVGGSQHGDITGRRCSQRGSNAGSPGWWGHMNQAQTKTVLKEAVDAVLRELEHFLQRLQTACVVESALLATAWQAVLVHPLSKENDN
ncbi:hypothetical protein ACOMHN_042366 [Nucella lapillus]